MKKMISVSSRYISGAGKWFVLLGILILSSPSLQAQQGPDPDRNRNIKVVEKELAVMAREILKNDSTELKMEINKQFIERLTHLLQRPEAFDYPFDSLRSLSILRSQDNSFRIFTWYFVDAPKTLLYADLAHYYFGLIQRKYVTAAGKTMYIVIPLMEMDQVPSNFDNMTVTNYSWFGALYYALKDRKDVPAYSAITYKLVPIANPSVTVDSSHKVLTVTYIPGKPKGRKFKEIYAIKYNTHDLEKVKNNYYVLTGWNGWNNQGSYKVVEVMSFDPADSSKVLFGAPIFYFDGLPKSRALFKYSEFSTFSLNNNYIKTGPLGMFKKQMIIFDHLAKANRTHSSNQVWDMGPDGTLDGLEYLDKYDCFMMHRNVTLAEKFNSRQHRKHLREVQKEQYEIASQDSVMQLTYFPDRKMARQNQKELKRQKAETDRKLKEAGIDIKVGRNERPLHEE
jgi:hypothetical protein